MIVRKKNILPDLIQTLRQYHQIIFLQKGVLGPVNFKTILTLSHVT